MIEYKDGQFGSISPDKDIIEMLYKQQNLDDIKAVHFGTLNELTDIRNNKVNVDAIHERINEIEREIQTLKPSGNIKIYSLEDIPK